MSTGNIPESSGHCESGVGARIRKSMAERGVSQTELAEKSGISFRGIHNIVHGISVPRTVTIGHLARALGVDVVWLLTGDSDSAQVREKPVPYPTRGESAYRVPQTIEAAIRLLATQFEMEPRELRQCLLECIVAHKTGAESARGEQRCGGAKEEAR